MKVYEYKGSWYYIFDIEKHSVTGKRRQFKKGGFKSEREAERAGIKAQVEYQSGRFSGTEKITFGEMAKIWFDEYKNKGKAKASTIALRTKEVAIWLNHFDVIKLKKINGQLIQSVVNQLSENYADSTMTGAISVLKMIFKKAKEYQYVSSLPTEFVYIPKQRKTLKDIEQSPIQNKYLEKETLKRFMNVVKDYGKDHDHALFKLLAYTGVRIGEATALKWSDINFDEKSISITKTIHFPKNNLEEFLLDTPKTSSSVRTIPVDDELIASLNQVKIYQHWFSSKYKKFENHDFVFVNYKKAPGRPCTISAIQRRLVRILKMAKIKQKVTPHTFRHTHTSLLAEAGVDLVTIMERLGHKDDSITRDIYLHVTKSLKKEAVVKFSKLMNDIK